MKTSILGENPHSAVAIKQTTEPIRSGLRRPVLSESGPIHKLPERHAYHEGAESHRCGGIGGVELTGNRRQRSQVHVDTQRSDSSQRGKGDDNGGRNTEGNFNVIRVLMTLLRGSL